MSTVAEARQHLEAIIGPVTPGTPLKSLFPRAARALGVTVRRIETLWQGTARRVDAAEMDRLRALSSAGAKSTAQSIEARNAARYDAIAEALEAVDPDFHRADIARYRGMAGTFRRISLAMGAVAGNRGLAL